MKNKILKTCLVLFIFLAFIGLTNSVNADMGPKPSITIKLENMDTTDYLIDLLVYDETGEKYLDEPNYNGDGLTEKEIELLHSINYDGWISEGTRWSSYLLFADCEGNSKFEHYFSYFGTPEIYKVIIINNENGEIKVSDVIKRTEFESSITLDVNSMSLKQEGKEQRAISKTTKNYFIPLIITIAVELVVSLAFIKIQKRNLLVIFITNVITNLLLQFAIRNWYEVINYIKLLLIGEIIVILLETLIYTKLIKDDRKSNVILYSIISNIATALMTFFLYIK